MKTKRKIEGQSTLDLLDQQYLEADNKGELDYWAPLARIIMESIALRDAKSMTQADLAQKMKTRQSVISRFENMGRLPSYKFFTKLALALGHAPGMTLYGDYMAVVPPEKQGWVRENAARKKIPPQRFVQILLNEQLAVCQASILNDTTTSNDIPATAGDFWRNKAVGIPPGPSAADSMEAQQMSIAA